MKDADAEPTSRDAVAHDGTSERGAGTGGAPSLAAMVGRLFRRAEYSCTLCGGIGRLRHVQYGTERTYGCPGCGGTGVCFGSYGRAWSAPEAAPTIVSTGPLGSGADGQPASRYRHLKKGHEYQVAATGDYADDGRGPAAEGDAMELRCAVGGGIATWTMRRAGGTEGGEVIATGTLQAAGPVGDGTPMHCYVGGNGTHWFRPSAEFLDGRFEAVGPDGAEGATRA